MAKEWPLTFFLNRFFLKAFLSRSGLILISNFLFISSATAASYTVTNTSDSASSPASGSLRYAIIQANSHPGSTITSTLPANSTINLDSSTASSPLVIQAAMTIVGSSGLTIVGNTFTAPKYNAPGGTPIFFIDPTVANSTISISHMTLKSGSSIGGRGGPCVAGMGGGGFGAGGGAYISTNANATFIDVNFNSNVAQGGNGGPFLSGEGIGSGGGGMISASGGFGSISGSGGDGGGGGGGLGAAAYGGYSTISGGNGIITAGPGGNGGGGGGAGGTGAGGGGGGNLNYGGGGGGNSGSSPTTGAGGAGGKFGGGGGAGGTGNTNGAGGVGGFGGGGGGSNNTSTLAAGGYGGGKGGNTSTGASGGSAQGGGVFVESGGTVTFQNSTQNTNFSGNSVAAGVAGSAGGSAGTADGEDIYAVSGTITFNVGAGLTQTLGDFISGGASSISGGAGIQLTGAGILALPAANAFTGGVTVSAGTLSIGNNAALGTGNLTLNGGTLVSSTAVVTTNNCLLNANSFIGGTNNLTLSGTIGLGGHALTINNTGGTITLSGVIGTGGSGSLVQNGVGGTLLLTAANNFTGGVTVTSGTLKTGSVNTIPAASSVTMNPANTVTATFNLNGFSQKIGVLSSSGLGTAVVTLGTAILTSDTTSISTYGGGISGNGTGSFVFQSTGGGGQLTLQPIGTNPIAFSGGLTLKSGKLILASATGATGGMNYTGGTTISGGTLQMGIANAMPSSTAATPVPQAVLMNPANTVTATFNLAGFNQTIGTLSAVNAGATAGTSIITLGSATLTSDTTGTSTYGGGMSGTGGFVFQSTGAGGGGQLTLQPTGTNPIAFSGGLTLKSGKLILASATGVTGGMNYTGGTTISGGTLQMGIANAMPSSTGTTPVPQAVLMNPGASPASATFDLHGFNQTIGTLSGTSTSSILLGTALQGAAILTSNTTGTSTYSGGMTGAGSLIVAGPGTLTLQPTNANPLNFTGSLTVSSGILQLASAATNGMNYTGGTVVTGGELRPLIANAMPTTGSVTLNGGLFDLNGCSQTIGAFSGSTYGAIFSNAGAATLTTNIPTNTTSTYSGTFGASTNVGLTVTNPGGNGTLILSPTSGGPINSLGSMIMTSGTVNFSPAASNIISFANGLTINGGILKTTTANAMVNNQNVTMNGGTFNLNSSNQSIGDLSGANAANIALGAANLTVNSTVAGPVGTTFAGTLGAVNDTGGLIKSGTGLLILSGTNNYNGTTINNGTLQVSAARNLGALAKPLTISNGATLQFSVGLSISNRAITLGTGGGIFSTTAAGVTMTLGNPATISGPGSLTFAGPGTLVLQSANTYTGGTFVTGGGISFATDTCLGVPAAGPTVQLTATNLGTTSELNFTNAAAYTSHITVQLNAGAGSTGIGVANAPVALAGVVSGAGALTYFGPNALTLTAANTYSDGTIFEGGILSVSADNNLGNTAGALIFNGGALNLLNNFTTARTIALDANANNTIQTAAGNTVTLTGPINNAPISLGELTFAGGGTFVLENVTSNYSGGTSIIANTTVQIASDANLGAAPTGALTFNNGTLLLAAGLNSVRNVALTGSGIINIEGNNATFSGVFSGAGAFTLAGSGGGILTLSGTNTNTGGITVAAAVPVVMGIHAAGVNTLEGTTLSFNNNNIVNNGTVIFNQNFSGNYAGQISGPGNLIITATNNAIVGFSGVSSFTGGTEITTGTLQMLNPNIMPTFSGVAGSGAVKVDNGAVFDLHNNNQIIGDLNGVIGSAVTLGTGTLTFGTANNGLFSGVISGANGNLIKQGIGRQTLAGANTYTGTTVIQAGTLALATNGSIAGNITSILNGATLEIAGGNVTGSITGANMGPASGTLLISQPFAPTQQINYVATIEVSGAGVLNLNNPGGVPQNYTNFDIVGPGQMLVNTPFALSAGGTLTVSGASAAAVGIVDLQTQPMTNNGTIQVNNFGVIKSTGNQILANDNAIIMNGGEIDCQISGGNGGSSLTVLANSTLNNVVTTVGMGNFIVAVDAGVLTINNTFQNYTDFTITNGAGILVGPNGLLQTQNNLTPINTAGDVTFAGGQILTPIIDTMGALGAPSGTSSVTVTANAATANVITNVATINVNQGGTLAVNNAITGFSNFNIASGAIANLSVPLTLINPVNAANPAALTVSGTLNTLGQTITGNANSSLVLNSSFTSSAPINGIGTITVNSGGQFSVASQTTDFNLFTIETGGNVQLVNTGLNLIAGAVLTDSGVFQLNGQTLSGEAGSIFNINTNFANNGPIVDVDNIIVNNGGAFTVLNAPTGFSNFTVNEGGFVVLTTALAIPNNAALTIDGSFNMGEQNITVGTTGVINVNGTLSTSGIISGVGGYDINIGMGSNFTVNNAVTGYTNLSLGNGGIITLKNGGNLSNPITMNGGTLNLNGGIFAGAINGTGTVNVNTLVNNPGAITIDTINVSKTGILNIAQPVTVNTVLNINKGGVLGLAANVTGNINNLGTINQPNTQTYQVVGDFTQQGTYNLSVADAATFSQLNVDGLTTLNGGAINVTLANGAEGFNTSGISIPIITSTGGFNVVSMPSISYSPATPTLKFNPVINGNDFNLVTQIITFSDIVNEEGAPGLSQVAGVLDANRTNPKFAPIINALDAQSTDAGIESVIAQLIPGETSGMNVMMACRTQGLIEQSVARHLTAVASGLNVDSTGYVAGDMAENKTAYGPFLFGGSTRQDIRSGISGYQATSGGFGFLWDTPIGDHLRMGAAIAYGGGIVMRDDGSRSSITMNTLQEMIYGRADYGPLFMTGLAAIGQNNYHGKRNVSVLQQAAISSYSGNQYGGKVEGGFTIPLYDIEISPMGSLQYTSFRQNSYTEQGLVSNLRVDALQTSTLQAGFGGKITAVRYPDEFIPEIHAMFLQDLKSPKLQTAARFVDGGGAFVSEAPTPPKGGFNVGGSISALMSDGDFLFTGGYDLEVRKALINQAVSLKFRWLF